MIDTLPSALQRRYIKCVHLVTGVQHQAGRITITRVTPVKRVLSRDRWQYTVQGTWKMISSGRVLHVTDLS